MSGSRTFTALHHRTLSPSHHHPIYLAPMRSALVFAFLFPALLSAQPDTSFTFTLQKYDVKDGLAHRRVNAMVQDRDGFLWIATPAGLQRFDGYTFILLTRADGMQANDAGAMWMDGNGLIWLFYNVPGVNLCKGIDILDPRTGSIKTIEEHFGDDLPLPVTDLVHWVRYTDDSTMLIGARGRLVGYHPRRGFSTTPPRSTDFFNPMHRFSDGSCIGVSFKDKIAFDRLLVRNADGTDRDTLAEGPAIAPLNGVEHSLEAFLRAGGEASRKGVYLSWRAKTEDEVGERWLPFNGAARALRASGCTDEPWSMHRRDLGNGLWLVHTTIRRMKAGDDPMTAPVLFDLAAENQEIDFRIYDAAQDAQGNLWLCTEFGLFKLTIHASRFQRWLWSAEIPQGFGMRVRGMRVMGEQGSERLQVNTEMEGFWSLDARSGRVVGSDPSPWLRFGIATDERGHLWRSEEDTVREFLGDGLSTTGRRFTSPRGCWAMYATNGAVLAEGADGLARYGAEHGDELTASSATGDAAMNAVIRASQLLHLGTDHAGILWACTSNGFYRLDDEGGPQERWSLDADEPHRIPGMDIRHFMQDEAGVFWLATGDAGLLRWDRKAGAVRSITRQQGLPSNAVHAVYADQLHRLWLPTDNGLVRYDPTTERIEVFTTADGITHDEFNRLAHAQGPDGRLYFGGLNGITTFDPATMDDRPAAVSAPLLFTTVQQFSGSDDRIMDRSLAVRGAEGITFLPGDRFLNIAFALLSFEDPQSILYGWRIDGVDADWNYQREPNLRITSLPYGEHLLRIKAQGSDGIWEARELTLPIHVVRPLYLRWWFIALCVLVIGGVVYAVFRYRLAQARKVVTLRDRIAADLHDEVGSSLTNIAMFGELMRDQANGQSPQFMRMLERVTTNSALALERMNDIVWNVNTRFEGAAHLVARMRAFAAQVAEARGFHLKFDVAQGVEGSKLDMEQRKEVYLIFKEAVNNAAKYSGCTELHVDLSSVGGKLRMVIADNGKGFVKGTVDPQGGGNGLPGMERRAQLIGARLEVETGDAHGTRVSLELVRS